MKLFVDDLRDAPNGWTLARTPGDAIRMLATMRFEEISLDHDAGAEERAGEDNFQSVAYFIGEKFFTNKPSEGFFDYMQEHAPEGMHIARPSWYPKITIHSANPIGAKKMALILKDYGIRAFDTSGRQMLPLIEE